MIVHQEAVPSTTHGSRWRRLLGPGAVVATTLAASAYVAAVDPNSPGHYPVCPTYAIAGIYCPGCGMLRATHDALHGDLAGMMARNPLSPLIYLGLVALLAVWVRARWSGTPLRWDPPRWLPAAMAAAFVVFTVARNIPGWTWLSPA